MSLRCQSTRRCRRREKRRTITPGSSASRTIEVDELDGEVHDEFIDPDFWMQMTMTLIVSSGLLAATWRSMAVHSARPVRQTIKRGFSDRPAERTAR
jgi:hypothetical protein